MDFRNLHSKILHDFHEEVKSSSGKKKELCCSDIHTPRFFSLAFTVISLRDTHAPGECQPAGFKLHRPCFHPLGWFQPLTDAFLCCTKDLVARSPCWRADRRAALSVCLQALPLEASQHLAESAAGPRKREWGVVHTLVSGDSAIIMWLLLPSGSETRDLPKTWDSFLYEAVQVT